MTMTLTTAAFEAGGVIPRKHTGAGEDVSPPLMGAGTPKGTKEYALICDDPDAPTPKPWVHWVLYKIPADRTSLGEGDNEGAVEGRAGARPATEGPCRRPAMVCTGITSSSTPWMNH